jgi:Uma2 family endonuclease
MSTLPKSCVTPEQYLEIDRRAERKSEYFDGEMFAMAGASFVHNLLVTNIVAGLHAQLRGKPCVTLPSDMRVRINPANRYAYPDVTVVCGSPEFPDDRRDILLNPALIVEVLSPSTALFDREFKFDAYTAIASLREYVLIASDRPSVDVFSRRPDGRWLLAKGLALQDSIGLESIGCRLVLADVYDRVEFPPTGAEARA